MALHERRQLGAAFDQPGQLLTRITSHPLEKAQHNGFLCSLQASTGETAYRTPDKAVGLLIAKVGPSRLLVREVLRPPSSRWRNGNTWLQYFPRHALELPRLPGDPHVGDYQCID